MGNKCQCQCGCNELATDTGVIDASARRDAGLNRPLWARGQGEAT